MTMMRSLFASKTWVVFLSMLALAALTILASGLGDIKFRAGQPFGVAESRLVRSVTLEIARNAQAVPVQTQLLITVLFILLFAMIGLLLSPELRKRLVTIAIRIALTYWVLHLLFTRYQEILAQMGLDLSTSDAGLGNTTVGASVPEFVPPPSTSWVAYVLSFGIFALLLFLAWKAYAIWNSISAPEPVIARDRLAKIARASILDLSSGRKSTDVILNCYYRMADAVSHRKNLDRNASMTPSEFASRLVSAGLPADAVRGLTRLFESVRYGGRKSDPQMVNEAVDCLTSILQYCRETA
jgi:hypothetical protein